jgi:hypothetical protein
MLSYANHASLDFYVAEAGLLCQVTIGQKHGIKRTGFETAINSGIFDEWKTANPTEKLRLAFLCDDFNFNSFKRQPYLITEVLLRPSRGKLPTEVSWVDNVLVIPTTKDKGKLKEKGKGVAILHPLFFRVRNVLRMLISVIMRVRSDTGEWL